MSKKLLFPVTLLVLLSLLLGACTTVAPVVVETTEAPVVVTEAPTEEPTAIPEPAPDFLALFTQLVNENGKDQGYGTISATALNEALVDKPPFLVDVREAAEIEKDGYIAGAIHLPIRTLTANLDKLPGLDDPIVIYCASGHRGGFAFAALKLLGYTNVKNLAGGIGAWKKAEFAVETGVPAAAAAISTPIVADQQLFTAIDGFITGLPEGFLAINAAKLNEELASGEAPVMVDTRRPDEVASNGYIDGAIFLPYETILTSLDQLPDKDQRIVIFCGSGLRGSVLTMALKMIGYTDVVNLGGGFGAWKAAQFPVAGIVDWTAVWSEFTSGMPVGFYSVSAADLNTAMVDKAPFLVDVRETAEVEKTGYIPGAIHLPIRELLNNLDKLPAQDQPIVIYCASGHRGGFGMAALRLLGYTDVRNLGGGINAWIKGEFAVETGVPAAPAAGTAPVVDEIRFRDLNAFISGLPEGFMTVSATDLNTELADAATAPFLLDVRTADELAADGYIAGSVHVPVTELFARLDQLPQDKAAKMVVLCKSGHRGAIALMALKMIGYTDVRNLGGGLGAWIAAQLPVEK
ncbi:MAG TPA: rhodanese-like domain-containing protein [Anaerolineaceae bacterium]|nr:rhodanese-like domain-containing protein [Anaerolineaceae bacterium]